MLGPPETSSTRLNLVQSFNSFGTLLAPLFGSYLILGRSVGGTAKAGTVLTVAERLQDAKAVQAPYVGIALVLLLIGVAIFVARLPKVSTHPQTEAERRDSVWRHPVFTLGVVAIFLYVGAEVAVGNFLISYIASPHVKNITTAEAARTYLPFYWGGLWIGRLFGSQIMRVVHPSLLLAINSIAAIAAITISIVTHGEAALWAILAIGLCNSIMFPTLFTQAIHGLGPLTGRASGFLIMAIFGGGVVPYVQGWFADHLGLTLSYFTAAPCYVFLLYFAWRARETGVRAPAAEPAAAALP